MCGIAGILGFREGNPSALVNDMVASIRYRGPDDAGIWSDPSVGLGLGHARLSILDLSPEGHQPMLSVSGRFVIVFNGEVYNFAELRAELEKDGARFRGHSDTEVMLAAFEAWGIESAVKRFVGMFAFALWDREAQALCLVRDRLGIKPLYFGWAGDAFVFGSELKAFRTYKAFDPVIDREGLCSFMRFGYVPAPFSIYKRVYKLMPGCMLMVTSRQARSDRGFSPLPESAGAIWKPTRYWSVRDVVTHGVDTPFSGTEDEALNQFEDLLKGAIKLRMVADVPLGAFLSGGIDSSVVVALMQTQTSTPVRTFTIGFHEADYNEAVHARQVARHLGTDHTELYVTSEQARAVILRLPSMYDEPFGDSSQIPTFLVSELARRHVTVALSGDGGDELFAGYNWYFWSRQLSWLPGPVRGAVATGITTLSPAAWSRVFKGLSMLVPAVQNPGDKMHKLAALLALRDPEIMHLGMVSQWRDPEQLVIGGRELPTPLTDRSAWPVLSDFTLRMMYLDLITYLPDDILTKVDRASMAVSLEARVPLLDHRVVEFAWSLPLSLKIRKEGEGKWLLRRLLDRYVPKELIERPKMGFSVPIDHWLRGPLREWAESLLDEGRLRREGFFNPEPIRAKWAEHLSGQRNWQYLLWNVLMFQAWLSSHDRSLVPAASHY